MQCTRFVSQLELAKILLFILNPSKMLMFSKCSFFFFFTARAGLFHLQPPRRQHPHDSFRIPAAAMQWHPAVGDDRGAAVPNALQTGSAHQEIHKDCCPVSIVPPIPQQCDKRFTYRVFTLASPTISSNLLQREMFYMGILHPPVANHWTTSTFVVTSLKVNELCACVQL